MWFLQNSGWIVSFFNYLLRRAHHARVRPLVKTIASHAQNRTQHFGRVVPCRLPQQPPASRYSAVGVPTPAARSAISTTLHSSIARVIGPTPPGLGVYAPATP